MPNEYVLGLDGRIAFRQTSETEIKVTDAMISALADKYRTRAPMLFHLNPEVSRPVGLCTTGAATFTATIRLDSLFFNSPFNVTDKVLVPVFAAGGTQPVLNVKWTVPETMNLVLLARLSRHITSWMMMKSWLFALSENGSSWRLPLANIYEDCSVCQGNFDSAGRSLFECLQKVYTQFRNAPWNADLYSSSLEDKTHRMFRWKANTDPFEQLEIDAPNWTNLCTKVSSPLTEEVCQ